MYDGAGSLFARGMRVTLLDDAGAPLVGANNCYVSESLIKIELGLEYEEAKEVVQLNGSGVACVNYQAPYTLKRGSIAGLQICTPDPNLLSFLLGGDTISDTATIPNQIGWRAPVVGVEERPNGISIEVWSRAIIGSAFAQTLPYLWWAIPRCYLTPSGTWSISATDAFTPEFTGYCVQNAGWGDGPDGLWSSPSDRVWQNIRKATMPDLTSGFVTIS